MDILLLFLVFASCVVLRVSAVDDNLGKNNVTVNETRKEILKNEFFFRTMLRKRRVEQIEALKIILNYDSYEKQYKMISIMLDKMFETVTSAKAAIENTDYIPGSGIPTTSPAKDALCQILDNTGLFGELRLKLPGITDLIMSKHKDWNVLVTWLIGFSNSTELFDVKTKEMMYLLSQELNMVERDPNYVNPYKTDYSKSQRAKDTFSKKDDKKKKKAAKGPRMSKLSNSEL